jgi:hypothetical protein
MSSLQDKQQETVQAEAVTDVVVPALRAFSADRKELIRTSFLTGSFISGRWRRERPNLNIYFVALPGRANDLRWELGLLWADLRARLASDQVELLVDCHPFTLSQREAGTAAWPLVTVTSKVLAGERTAWRFDLPPTIGPGWAANFEVITGDPADVELLARSPSADEAWVRAVHSALGHYRNVLDHVPWALDVTRFDRHVVEESARYAEESLKDALSFRLDAQELSTGRHIVLLDGWQTAAGEYISSRYGEAGVDAARRVAALKAAAADPRPIPAESVRDWWTSALLVWDWAWTEFLEVVHRIMPGTTELTRIDVFL